jgi:hypothetical protein
MEPLDQLRKANPGWTFTTSWGVGDRRSSLILRVTSPDGSPFIQACLVRGARDKGEVAASRKLAYWAEERIPGITKFSK